MTKNYKIYSLLNFKRIYGTYAFMLTKSIKTDKKRKRKRQFLMDNVTNLFRRKRIGSYASMLPQKMPNFPEHFRADNGKNRNIPERNLNKQTIK